MSQNLYWERISTEPENRLSKGLKGIIERRWGFSVELSSEHIQWLEGVKDATVSSEIVADCNALIELIRDDGAVKLTIR